MENFATIVSFCSGIMTIFALICILVKPFRERILKTKQKEEEQKKQIDGLTKLSMNSTLNTMTQMYYKAMNSGEMHQWEYDSFCTMYEEYHNLGGNHWSSRMNDDLKEIKVIPN